MTAGNFTRFLDGYDEDAEVEMYFSEAGEAYASTFDVPTFSHYEMGSGVRNDWPTITAAIGRGTMTEHELRLVIDHVKGIDRRLVHNGA